MPREKTAHTKPKMIHIRLSDELHHRLRVQVANKNLTIQDYVFGVRTSWTDLWFKGATEFNHAEAERTPADIK